MISFPNCKINLGLHITGKRQDGYHDIETVFFPIPFTDALEIIPASGTTHLTVSGLEVSPTNNLCLQAYELIKKDFPLLPPVHIQLLKAIPLGAGLGGGSADGAFTLRLINDFFKLSIIEEKLLEYALQLGSDCPFFILNKPALAKGRGELLQPVSIDLLGHTIVLINPGIHINTGWAFSTITPKAPAINWSLVLSRPVANWKDELTNDFEQPVFAAYPAIQHIKEKLYKHGALYASMTGSGSTVYGIFKDTVDDNSFSGEHFYKKIIIK